MGHRKLLSLFWLTLARDDLLLLVTARELCKRLYIFSGSFIAENARLVLDRGKVLFPTSKWYWLVLNTAKTILYIELIRFLSHEIRFWPLLHLVATTHLLVGGRSLRLLWTKILVLISLELHRHSLLLIRLKLRILIILVAQKVRVVHILVLLSRERIAPLVLTPLIHRHILIRIGWKPNLFLLKIRSLITADWCLIYREFQISRFLQIQPFILASQGV